MTIVPAAERLLEQWPAIQDYFLKFIPTKADYIMSNTKYKQITNLLKLNDIKLKIEFVIESSKVFIKFTEQFQKVEPLIHILYDELKMILQSVAGRICKKEKINTNAEIDSTDLLAVKDVVINSTLPEKDKLLILHKIQKHYIAAYNYLYSKVSAQDESLLPVFKCLQPTEIGKSESVNNIVRIELQKLCHLQILT